MSIMDDYSRKLWLYILKDKTETEVMSKFSGWLNEVENEKSLKLKCLRTDNGLEFVSGEMTELCKEKGIKRHKTVPGTPQQNGVIERMNRTILNKIRCMLFDVGMSKKFWGEAAVTAAYLINRSPSSVLNGKTPDELWYGRAPNYSHLRVFGCRAYAHIRQDKLEPRALKCVMLGYPQGVKGYKLWCTEPEMGKVIISRSVVFNETQMPYLEPASSSSGVQLSGEDDSMVQVGDLLQRNAEVTRLGGVGAENLDSESDNEDVSHQEEETEPEDLSNYQLARDRQRRSNVAAPQRYGHAEMIYFCLCTAEEVVIQEPKTYSEAMKGSERIRWLRAMKEEMDSLVRNGTWVLVSKTETMKLVTCKWIYKKKFEFVGGIEKVRFKARLVARGFTQKEGIDYNEVFSPVVKHTSIRILLAMVAHFDFELEQMDVKTAFLHGELEEDIYMAQPEGFVQAGDENKVCLLKKSLYGRKQSSRQWYKKFGEQMVQIGFSKSDHDSCVFLKRRRGVTVAYLLLYVDDMLIASRSKTEIKSIKKDLNSCFEMKDLGEAKRILGMDIIRDRSTKKLWLTQRDYILKMLKKFNMQESKILATPLAVHLKFSDADKPKPMKERAEMKDVPYSSLVGSLMYTMVCTRPDMAHAISVMSRYMVDPGKSHWEGLKKILRYLKGTADYGILFKRCEDEMEASLVGYTDSDYAANLDNRRSQSGYVFNLYGAAVSWKSQLQHMVALSTTEAEYMAATEAVKEAVWLKGMISDLNIVQDVVVVRCDSQSALYLMKHQTFHERSKHIDVRLHFIREIVEKGEIKMEKVSTEENAADMLTKALPSSKFVHCLELVGLSSHA